MLAITYLTAPQEIYLGENTNSPLKKNTKSADMRPGAVAEHGAMRSYFGSKQA